MSKDTKEPDLSPSNKATTSTPSSNDHGKNPRASSSSSSSSSALWFRLKDPRIVRVSRAFGGKDRHSKVCTVKGLRDRRVRLSVPTAIQLYDLQDRLGFSQPSKVVDWLLEAAKHEIDQLPPLPTVEIPLGNLAHHLMHHQSNRQGLIHKEDNRVSWQEPTGSTSKSKDFIGDASHHNVIDAIQSDDPSLNYLHTHTIHGFMPQHDQTPQNNGELSAFSSTLSLSSQPRFPVYQPSRGTQAYFEHHLGASLEIDPRNVNSFHMPTSASPHNMLSDSATVVLPPPFSMSSLRPLHLSLDYPKFPSQNDFEAQTSKD